MALKKPIVTTDMNECRKYKSVLIAQTAEDFILKLDNALKLKNNTEYLNKLDKEAKENDWSQKAQAIISLISKKEK